MNHLFINHKIVTMDNHSHCFFNSTIISDKLQLDSCIDLQGLKNDLSEIGVTIYRTYGYD